MTDATAQPDADAMQAMLPAYARSLGIVIESGSDGSPIVALEFVSMVEGRPQHLHGGAIGGLLETAGYAALRAALTAQGTQAQLKPINITTQYLSAGKSQKTWAQGRITKLGRRIANVTVEAWQADRQRPIASAIMNIMVQAD